MADLPAGVRLTEAASPHGDTVVTAEALGFLARLHRAFDGRGQELLRARHARQAVFDSGELPEFLPRTCSCAFSAFDIPIQAAPLR